jgi:hypothetical protein
MKAYGVVDVYIHIFLNSALVGGERSASRPGRFTPGERAPRVGGWVGPKAGLDDAQRSLVVFEITDYTYRYYLHILSKWARFNCSSTELIYQQL